jgi:GTP-binding protein HflX
VHCTLALPHTAGRLRARLIALGFVAGERLVEGGWEVQLDAPRAQIEALFGLAGGEGEWLRERIAEVDADAVRAKSRAAGATPILAP